MINQIGNSAPATGQAAAPTPGGSLGKDEFLKMLVAQMRNQDPLNPMKGDQMAAQLAQFSALEQMTNMGEGIQELVDLTGSMGGEIYQALNATSGAGLVGKSVLAETNQVEIGGAETPAVTIELGGRGASATLRILDANGNEVGSRDLGSLGAGRHEIELGSAADGLADGVYSFEVKASSGDGEEVPVLTYVKAHVDGVRYGPEGTTLLSGGLRLPLPYVREITNG